MYSLLADTGTAATVVPIALLLVRTYHYIIYKGTSHFETKSFRVVKVDKFI